ncbi:Synaptic vesicle protein [Operophtera brumata]|uniref:Synaptic vesicle protein n=1 Tax=Operophtera brumata TaxID=104452 RepID=A0A0L7L391_OPEBR|nr:Synaptic vesicle protein [Operophtera brumata]
MDNASFENNFEELELDNVRNHKKFKQKGSAADECYSYEEALDLTGIIVMSYPWGYLSDTRGRKLVLMCAMCGSFISAAFSSLAPNWQVLAALRFISSAMWHFDPIVYCDFPIRAMSREVTKSLQKKTIK